MRSKADIFKGCEDAKKYDWIEAIHNVLSFFCACYEKMRQDSIRIIPDEEDMRDKFLENYVQPKSPLRKKYNVHQMVFNSEVKELNTTANGDKYLDIKIDNIFPLNSYDNEVNQEEYLIFECKRLKKNKKNKLYLDEGLMRFIKGEYAKNLGFAGMIGFVEEHKGLNLITKDLQERIKALSYTQKDLAIYTENNIPNCYHSQHKKDFEPYQVIDVFHLLFDYTTMIQKG